MKTLKDITRIPRIKLITRMKTFKILPTTENAEHAEKNKIYSNHKWTRINTNNNRKYNKLVFISVNSWFQKSLTLRSLRPLRFNILDFIRVISVICFSALLITGCASDSSVVYERQAKRQIALSEKYKGYIPQKFSVEPPDMVSAKNGIEIAVRYAPRPYLDEYFRNEEIFGQYAGTNPYHPWTIVFYVKIANTSGQTIKIAPEEFVIMDDLNSQYNYLSPDYIIALYESGASVSGFVKTTGDIAPGPYGIPFKLVGMGGVSKKRQAVLKQVTLSSGYLYNNVIYDGYIAFLHPHKTAKKLTLLLPNIKIGFDKENKPLESIDFEFQFDIK